MIGNRNQSSNFGCLIILVLVALLLWFAFVDTVGAMEPEEEADRKVYVYNVVKIVSWIQENDPDENRGETGNIGIILGSAQCPEGAVQINYEVYPEIFLDEFTEECEGGLQSIGGREYVNVMDHMLELRIQYKVHTDKGSYAFDNMYHDEFWFIVFMMIKNLGFGDGIYDPPTTYFDMFLPYAKAS